MPAFLSSFLHYAGRRPCWQVIPALAVGPASPCSPPALCSGAPARQGWWAAPRPRPAPPHPLGPRPPSPPAAEPGLLSWAESWSLKDHSAKLGPRLSINAAVDSGYSCLRGERSLGTVFAMKGSPTVHPRCSRFLLRWRQKPLGKVVRGGLQRLPVRLPGAEGTAWGSLASGGWVQIEGPPSEPGIPDPAPGLLRASTVSGFCLPLGQLKVASHNFLFSLVTKDVELLQMYTLLAPCVRYTCAVEPEPQSMNYEYESMKYEYIRYPRLSCAPLQA